LLEIDPKNATIMSNLGVLYFNSGRKDRGVKMFGDAHAAAPQDKDIRRNYLNALGVAAHEKSALGANLEAISLTRKALALDPDHAGMRINLANLLEFSGQPAALGDFMPNATPEQLGTHLLVACMPKSGSTFLKTALCTLTGWAEAHFAYAYLQNEQELYLPNVIMVARHNTVTQQHCRATGPNTQILQAFGVRPVVLVRNLPDIVLSLSDFYDSGAVVNTFFGDVWPTLGAQGKYNLIIDQVMPWYAGFYASWERAQRLGRLDCFFLTYEEMLADKPATIARISDFLGLGKTAEECAAAVRTVDGDAAKTRFNKGVAGRGQQALDDDQKARLRRLVTAYGPVNLERVGLAD
jgi:tetratricopeptide (TPR) repeat protein